jgi:uncharacterized membrane protein
MLMMNRSTAVRDDAIDWLRGVVMALMVLDHARDFWHGIGHKPLDLASTTPLLFATRWITHFCAPVFVFLAGTAAHLYGVRRGAAERTRYLLSRGVFLVLLEITVLRLLWMPDLLYRFTLLQVIWAIGWSMLALAGLSLLPRWVCAGVGALLVGCHNALDNVHAAQLGSLGPLWSLLHERAILVPAPGHSVLVSYPLVPWIGVMALGYAFGPVVQRPQSQRGRICVGLGLSALVAFVLLRAANGYGDPTPWTSQPAPLYTLLSFINCEKYPPSLDFLLMTLGPALLLLAAAPALSARLPLLTTFGKVPLFFYVAHLFVLRATSLPVALAAVGERAFLPPPRGTAGSPELALGITYIAWLATLLLLYPVCRWYARARAKRRFAWSSHV